MKVSVFYDSKSSNTKQCAEWICEGAMSVEGVEAKAFNIADQMDEVSEAFGKDSKCIILGCPSYGAQMTPNMRNFLFSGLKSVEPAGKLAGAFSTEQFSHGGSTLVIQSIQVSQVTSGMLVYSGGGSKGMPVIHLGPVAINNNVEKFNGIENYKDNFIVYGKKMAVKACELFK